MSRFDEPSPSEKSPKPRRFNPFLARSRALSSGGPSGLEATTIGFTLVGFIVAGAGAGWLIDKWLGTSYWLPILFLVGVFGGFREMMLVLKRVNQAQAADKLRKDNERRAREISAAPSDYSVAEQSAARQRMFPVPPPPFEAKALKVHDRREDSDDASAPKVHDRQKTEEPGDENVLRQLLAQGDLSAADLKKLGFDVELPPDEDEKSDDSARAR